MHNNSCLVQIFAVQTIFVVSDCCCCRFDLRCCFDGTPKREPLCCFCEKVGIVLPLEYLSYVKYRMLDLVGESFCTNVFDRDTLQQSIMKGRCFCEKCVLEKIRSFIKTESEIDATVLWWGGYVSVRGAESKLMCPSKAFNGEVLQQNDQDCSVIALFRPNAAAVVTLFDDDKSWRL